MKVLPIEYTAITRAVDGHEGSVDLEESNWFWREDVRNAQVFTLNPKPNSGLPVISVALNPLADGTHRELIFFSRPYGKIGMQDGQLVSLPEQAVMLFRVYCVGWRARVGGVEIRSVAWVIPGGSVIFGDFGSGDPNEPPEPPSYVSHDLLEHYWEEHQRRAAVPA